MARAPVSKTGGWGFESLSLLPSTLLSACFTFGATRRDWQVRQRTISLLSTL